MIYKRVAARLQAQDWLAITIEFGIVVAGVFVGTWVANLNQERGARADTIRLLDQLRPEIRYQEKQYRHFERYLKTTGGYTQTALAGWGRDPAVSDNAFVIAAYQASQITGSTTSAESWASMFGNDQVQNIRDPELRTRLIRVLSLDATVTDFRQSDTDYRKNVRQTIPNDVQDAIRTRCGEIAAADDLSIASLPPTCDLVLPAADAAAVAAALRARPSLVTDLNWHRAAAASLLYTYAGYVRTLKTLDAAIEKSGERDEKRGQ